MSLVTVIATQAFVHQGRQIHRGEAVTLEALEAAVHAQARRVSLDKDARATYRTTEAIADRQQVLTAADPPSNKSAGRRARRARRAAATRA